jgi:hypothetical protein
MTWDEVEILQYATKVIDIITGEELTFYQCTENYVLCYDWKGLTIWIQPERIKLK